MPRRPGPIGTNPEDIDNLWGANALTNNHLQDLKDLEVKKRESLKDLAELIQYLTGENVYFAPWEKSDQALDHLADKDWTVRTVDARDPAKTSKMPWYIGAVQKARDIPDLHWSMTLRRLYAKLNKSLQSLITEREDQAPEEDKHLKRLAGEIHEILTRYNTAPLAKTSGVIKNKTRQSTAKPSSEPQEKFNANNEPAQTPSQIKAERTITRTADTHALHKPKLSNPDPNSQQNQLSKNIQEIQNIAAKSPTLINNFSQLQQQNWKIIKGKAGGGSYMDRNSKTITVDANKLYDPVSYVRTIAHESGHALYIEDPYITPGGLTKQQYVDANVKRNLKDEGEATLMNAQIREEILLNGGPDIGISGSQAAMYEKSYLDYKKHGDREKAREEIGNIFANNERPSTDLNKTYKGYYSQPYEDFWDQNIKKP